jgi:putative tricarboxylic transport membrane protein
VIDLPAAADALALLSSSLQAWSVVIPGLLIGLVFGAVPGLSVPIAMAVFMPVTFYMEFLPAILFLTAIFTGGGFGGAVPAILMNIPGTSAAVATTFDGYPMSRAGRHNEALGAALAASTIGAAVGYLLLFFLIDPIAGWVLRLGPPEMLVVALWGLTLIAALSEQAFAKGLLAGLVGVLIGTIGMSSRGFIRGTFDSIYLLDGVPAVPALMGLFALSELFTLAQRSFIVADERLRRVSFAGVWAGVRATLAGPVILLRGALLGVGVGAVPGVGSSVANLLSYAETRRRARNPENFGKGDIRGVTAAEAANSSSEGGSMATLLVLGLPGGAATAVMLAAFNIHDVTGGPRFVADNKDIVYAIVFANLAQAILLLGLGLGFVFVAARIVKAPLRVLAPSVIVLAVMGAYALTGSMVGPVTVAAAAVLGFFMRRYGYPTAAAVVGILLGGMAEGEALRTYQLSGGDASFLLTRPIALVFFALLLLSVLYPLVKKRRAARRDGGHPPLEQA